jgi:hypothetical protein
MPDDIALLMAQPDVEGCMKASWLTGRSKSRRSSGLSLWRAPEGFGMRQSRAAERGGGSQIHHIM